MQLLRCASFLVGATAVVPALRAQSLTDRARAALERGQVDSAYELIQLAADAEPGRADVQWLLGRIACEKAGRSGPFSAFSLARKCKAALARAVELAPDSLTYLESLAGYLAQAPGIAGGDRDSALKLAETVRRRDDARGDLLEASLLWSGNADAKARADSLVEGVVGRHPADELVQLRAAGWWAGTGRPGRALAVYEGMAARDPKDPVAHFFVGRQLVLLRRDLRRAQEQLRLAAAAPEPPPGSPRFVPGAPWYRLGQTYEQLAMPDSARMCFEEALRINPQLTPARLALDSLSRP
jgi:tetratricopeptide (TPR) repeat protein